MNPLRRSYEAKILVVPLGARSDRLAHNLVRYGVDGIRVLTVPDVADAVTQPLGENAWDVPTPAGTAQVVDAADMVVLLGTDLAEVPLDVLRVVCEAGRSGGDLIAAVLVQPSNWEVGFGAAAMVTLRQEVDMLVSVQEPEFVAALLDVLRGGPRVEIDDALVEEVAA